MLKNRNQKLSLEKVEAFDDEVAVTMNEEAMKTRKMNLEEG